MEVTIVDALASAVKYMGEDKTVHLLIKSKQIEVCLGIDDIKDFSVSLDSIDIALDCGSVIYLDYKTYTLVFNSGDNGDLMGIRLFDEDKTYIDLSLVHLENNEMDDMIYGILDDN